MPQEFTAVLVKGRGNYISLRRLDAALARAGATFRTPRSSTSSRRSASGPAGPATGLGPTSTSAPCRASGRPSPARTATAWAKNCPRYKECFYFKARRRMWSANILVVNHALFITDLALRGAGASLLPDYEVAIFDEAHTLEEVAGEQLGLKLTSGQVEYTLTRLYNDRSGKGLLVYHRLAEARDQVQRTRLAAREFFEGVADWQARHGAANGRLRKPMSWPDTLAEELRKLSAAIGRGAEAIDEQEQRVELLAAQDRCDGLAASLDSWLGQEVADSVYWIEVEPTGRRRVTLSCARSTSGRPSAASCSSACRPAC